MTAALKGFEEFESSMKRLSAAAQHDTAMSALEAGGYVIMAHAQENARNKLNQHPLGNLTNSIGVKKDGNLVLVGVWGVIYAAIHEFGGVISAKNKPFLAFQIDGKWIFTKSVHMPARPYLRPAVDDHMSEIKQAVSDALRGLLQGAL